MMRKMHTYRISCDCWYDLNGEKIKCKEYIDVVKSREPFKEGLPCNWEEYYEPCSRGCCGTKSHRCPKHHQKS